MPSTSIKSFSNYVPATYTFSNLQSGHTKTVTLGKFDTAGSSMDIPYCNNEGDWKDGKYITVTLGNTIVYYIWQHKDSDGDYDRYSTTGYVSGAAPHLPGEPSSGGDKGLAVMTDGSLLMTTYS